MRGRKPTPTATKVARGNPGKRPLNGGEPQFPRRLPRAPEHLSDGAKAEWKRAGRLLLNAGVMTEADRATLAAYCTSYDRWVEAEKQVAKLGPIVKTSGGNLIQNPYLSVANRAMGDMCKLAGELGFSPVSRTRIHAAGEEEVSLGDLLFAQAAERAKAHADDDMRDLLKAEDGK